MPEPSEYEKLSEIDAVSPLLETDEIHVIRGDGSPIEHTSYRATLADVLALVPAADNGYTAPVDADFSWLNQEGATVTQLANGGLYMLAPGGTGTDIRARIKAAPSTPYSIIAALNPLIGGTATSQLAGLCFSDGTKLYTICFTSTQVARVTRWNSATSHSAEAITAFIGRMTGWLKIRDDGTNIKFYYGDGTNWIEMFSQTRTTFLTPSHVGWLVNSENNPAYDAGCTLLSWEETA